MAGPAPGEHVPGAQVRDRRRPRARCTTARSHEGGDLMAKMIVGGEHVDARDGAVMEIRNPATGELVDTVPRGSAEDVRQAVDVAYESFRKWADTPAAKRAE